MEDPASPEIQHGINMGGAGIPVRSYSAAATHPERPTGGRGGALWTLLPSTPLLFVPTAASHSTEGPEVPSAT